MAQRSNSGDKIKFKSNIEIKRENDYVDESKTKERGNFASIELRSICLSRFDDYNCNSFDRWQL